MPPAPASDPATRQVPDRASDTTPDTPWPLRLLTHNIGMYVARMPALWVEAQIVSLKRRPGAGAGLPRPARHRRRDVHVGHLPRPPRWTPPARRCARAPASSCGSSRASTPSAAPSRCGCRWSARSARASCWPGSSSSSGPWPARACSPRTARSRCRSCPARSGWSAGGAAPPSTTSSRTPAAAGRRCGSRCARSPSRARPPCSRSARRWPSSTRLADVDVIVVARGGGSTEDLLPFSNEALLRAVAACRTPVVSAIGHEEDTPLLDLVADVRASTPTDAARRVVPDAAHELDGRGRRPASAAGRCSAAGWSASATCCGSCGPGRPSPTCAGCSCSGPPSSRTAAPGSARPPTRGLHRRDEQLRATLAHLRALSPGADARARVRHRPDPGRPRRARPGEVAAGDPLEVTVARGGVGVAVAAGPEPATTPSTTPHDRSSTHHQAAPPRTTPTPEDPHPAERRAPSGPTAAPTRTLPACPTRPRATSSSTSSGGWSPAAPTSRSRSPCGSGARRWPPAARRSSTGPWSGSTPRRDGGPHGRHGRRLAAAGGGTAGPAADAEAPAARRARSGRGSGLSARAPRPPPRPRRAGPRSPTTPTPRW